MRDEKEGRKKQARSNKQQGKATQHMTIYGYVCIFLKLMFSNLTKEVLNITYSMYTQHVHTACTQNMYTQHVHTACTQNMYI